MAGTYNITTIAGDTIEFQVLLKDPSDAPMDLTGYTAKAQIRASATATDVLLEFNVIGSLDSTGLIHLRIEAPATEILRTTNAGVWDLEITRTSDNTRLTVLGGTVRASLDVTRE